MQLVLADN